MKIKFSFILSCILLMGIFVGCDIYPITTGYKQFSEPTASVEKTTVSAKLVREAFSLKLEELKADYTYFERNQTGNMTSEWSSWFGPKGVLCGSVMDFDLDGQDEMAVFYTDVADAYELDYNAFLTIYEYHEGNVNIGDDMLFDAYINTEYIAEPTGFLWDSRLSTDESIVVSTKVVNNKNYIICEHSRVSKAFSDVQSYNYWMLSYTDEKLRYENSFTQTEGENTGFEYTGYKFENGLEAEAPLYYAMDYENAKYDDYVKAITNYFKEYGFKVRSDYKQFEVNGSIFESEGRTELFSFTNKSKKNPETYSYDFVAKLEPNKKYEP